MEIKTKFNIGQKVWTIEINKQNGINTVEVLSGVITNITIEKDNTISYFFYDWCADYKEEDIIAYEDTKTLINKIIQLDNKIKENKIKENK